MFEPFKDNYIWNLQVNLALVCGGNHGEVDVACRPIIEAAAAGGDAGTAKLFDSWIAVADQVCKNAEADEAEGYLLSAGTKYGRAFGYYLSAERMQSRDYAPRWAAYDKGLALYKKYVECSGLHVDFIDIPYEGSSYPAIFVHDGSGEPRPALVSCNGLDSMKEQVMMAGHGIENLRRGINTLLIDQPGTGEALRKRGLPAVYDTERWATPAWEYLASRSDVIANKIGMFGLSLGGYYAPRAAANEPRFALCAVMGANHVWGERQKQRLEKDGENPVPHYWDHVMWVWGKDNMEDFMAYMPNVTLDGQIEKLKMPFLVTHGAGDRQIPLHNAHRSYDQAVNSSKRHLRIFDEADFEIEHCGADNGTVMRDYIADWCAQTFAEIE
ncbi:MAG: alpha/beta hydrolase [Alteromonadaceae bacterium]|uniref:alpha/beta hydrolase family protein n=1 Tax=Paraglaciecola chathamensis TaxID=368405 RepID=UPI000C62184C|nr:prolyl oligopeptidase family serine peptidase [Paraglaciecola agarilytica]MBN27819.1 alpha/beta hydrolase [Alteromonadaceae bacterium]|tara:strand:- start:18932 stop:20083 length:1152 start_codon:yes stop_codon:yes gene_type:complete